MCVWVPAVVKTLGDMNLWGHYLALRDRKEEDDTRGGMSSGQDLEKLWVNM